MTMSLSSEAVVGSGRHQVFYHAMRLAMTRDTVSRAAWAGYEGAPARGRGPGALRPGARATTAPAHGLDPPRAATLQEAASLSFGICAMDFCVCSNITFYACHS